MTLKKIMARIGAKEEKMMNQRSEQVLKCLLVALRQ